MNNNLSVPLSSVQTLDDASPSVPLGSVSSSSAGQIFRDAICNARLLFTGMCVCKTVVMMVVVCDIVRACMRVQNDGVLLFVHVSVCECVCKIVLSRDTRACLCVCVLCAKRW